MAVHVFGVRHLSPGAAWHLRAFLDEIKPKAVLVEGPADFTPLIPEITAPGVVPPIAMLAYTKQLPVRTILYPLATYSPEFQALLWARKHRAVARFIDLPTATMIGLEEAQSNRAIDAAEETQEGNDAPSPDKHALRREVYDTLAREAGLADHDTYWEQHFEHNLATDAYRQAALAFGQGLRELERELPDLDFAENLTREAHMRREVARCLEEEGFMPEQVVVIVGAFHAANVQDLEDPLTDALLASLPAMESDLTLMPYSYYRLSSQSGYGAGNRAPAYFELLWENLTESNHLDQLGTDYLSRLVREHRSRGTHRSTAEVIEGVRLARSLASLKGALQPTLRDLKDAAITLLGHGQLSAVADAMVAVEVGTRIGKLPSDARQTSIQLDFSAQLQKLKLERYRAPVSETIQLDLRENRRVQDESAAYLDLNRSFFLHRLYLLGIHFGKPPSFDRSSPWFEVWNLQWEPEREIELVEAVLLGDTIELAVGLKFANELADAQTVEAAAILVWKACLCGLPDILLQARRRLQAIAANSSDFVAIVNAAFQLGQTLKYGDVRKVDLEPLAPLLVDLYNQATIQFVGACVTDAQGAQRVAQAMSEMHAVGDDHHELLDESLWLESLAEVATRDDLNAFLSGVAAALLLERNALDDDVLNDQVSKRLSPGMDADLGAGWFEGLSSRNRYGLLSRMGVWKQLAVYIRDMAEDEFPRALVFLRRAIGTFTPAEKRHIAENLGELWQKNREQVSEALETPLNDDEQEALEELQDMDFDDL